MGVTYIPNLYFIIFFLNTKGEENSGNLTVRRWAPSCGRSITGLGTRCRVLSALVLAVILPPSSLLWVACMFPLYCHWLLVALRSAVFTAVKPSPGSLGRCQNRLGRLAWVWCIEGGLRTPTIYSSGSLIFSSSFQCQKGRGRKDVWEEEKGSKG